MYLEVVGDRVASCLEVELSTAGTIAWYALRSTSDERSLVSDLSHRSSDHGNRVH